jgi:serpin B
LTLHIANGLFGQRGYDFEPSFTTRLATSLAAPLEQLDFAGNTERARTAINARVAKQTEKKIKDLLPVGSLDAKTNLVLVNAVYFVGKWASPFRRNRTSRKPFWVTSSAAKNVLMMRQIGTFRVAEVNGGDVIELDYRNGAIAMYVVRPGQRDGLAAVEQRLGDPVHWLADLREQRVDLSLPQFVVDPAATSLDAALANLGILLAFDATNADFTGIAKPSDPSQNLYLSTVFHKAFVKTDEEGTVAAAGTGGAGYGSTLPPTRPFVVDRPFMFFIMDRISGLVLFMGRVVDPH